LWKAALKAFPGSTGKPSFHFHACPEYRMMSFSYADLDLCFWIVTKLRPSSPTGDQTVTFTQQYLSLLVLTYPFSFDSLSNRR
jgi:hypothetical protein